jgi:macrolide-specific efflux system membrane fusion protein
MAKSRILSALRRHQKIIGVLVMACVAGAGWYWLAGATDGSQNKAARLVAVSHGTIEEAVTAQGRLEPKQYVDVGTQVSGQLKKIHVDIGSTVKKGQLLAEIDPRVFQAQVEASEARLTSLRAQLDEQRAQSTLAEQNLRRNRNLIAVNAISQQVLEESESQAAVAKAQLDSITAQIQEVESTLKGNRANLEYTKIFAPMAGTVTMMPAREGQTLNANQTTPTVMQVADLEVMTVRAQVAEADVPHLKEGMPAYFTTLGEPLIRWEGKVLQILPTPQIVNDVVLFDVLIDVRNDRRRLMPGMTTQVFFVSISVENAAIVPAEALSHRVVQEDNDKGKAYRVTVVTETGQEPRLIHVGLQTRTQAQVTSGLHPGERVVLGLPANGSGTTNGVRRATTPGRFNRGPQL